MVKSSLPTIFHDEAYIPFIAFQTFVEKASQRDNGHIDTANYPKSRRFLFHFGDGYQVDICRLAVLYDKQNIASHL